MTGGIRVFASFKCVGGGNVDHIDVSIPINSRHWPLVFQYAKQSVVACLLRSNKVTCTCYEHVLVFHGVIIARM